MLCVMCTFARMHTLGDWYSLAAPEIIARDYLKSLLGEFLTKLVSNPNIDLEIDPVKIAEPDATKRQDVSLIFMCTFVLVGVWCGYWSDMIGVGFCLLPYCCALAQQGCHSNYLFAHDLLALPAFRRAVSLPCCLSLLAASLPLHGICSWCMC